MSLYAWTRTGGIPDPAFISGWAPSVVYGSTVTPNLQQGCDFVITVTNGVNFTIANPTGIQSEPCQRISIQIVNASGGTLGSITWGSAYYLAPWQNPGNGYSRSIEFRTDTTNTYFVERSRTTVDVPNPP